MIQFLYYLNFLLVFVVFAVYAERKISAFIQDRIGPMEVGYKGLLQTVADLLKMLQKEDIVPRATDKWLFLSAPVIIFLAIFTGYALLPLNYSHPGADVPSGVFLLLAIVALDVIGILMAGWASNNKYSLYGSMRSVAQMVSYEVPLGLSVISVALIAGSLDLNEISVQQGILFQESNYFLGIKALGLDVSKIGGILSWNIFRAPVLIPVFIIFFISSLAESNRAPFDLPETESEIIGGYHTEYSGFRWSIFMLGEYGMMLLVSYLAAILFFGGWNTPFPNISTIPLAEWTTGTPGSIIHYLWAFFWLTIKSLFLIFVQMWIRWTYPRLRVDQLMSLSWKYLTPFAILLLFVSATWKMIMI
ncbi:MAG TPA: NADH-quinone oxidoreductase subunit H [Cyclobacteriaceae bacterium]